ncbi:TlpA family protein disulfide reductase [Oceanobacillus jeddahense]|uniref:TlpA family protein disulfide reductase n=1 Tax=Oceanobacillus jeddahense TaxID=1462527 RepID=A0ABY5JLW1_9BACI|nr:TlpA disulfide reductase family protein [Oceanobacillus jeddahense]UUI01278.1 TlpA family protein disulfide reductase [Oceanobacillus jeddahense]
MYKRIFALVLLLVLVGIVIANVVQDRIADNTTEEEEEAVLVDDGSSSQGAAIAPAESAGVEPGEPAPDFELETLEGDNFRLSDLQGQKVILNFWYSWCPPCIEEMPEIQEFYEDYQDEVEVVAVNMTTHENQFSDVGDFIEEHGHTFTVPLDKEDALSDPYVVYAAPTTYFIGTDGTIQQPRKIGPMDYEFMEEMVQGMD